MMKNMNNCAICKFNDEFGFCEKLVVDTKWCVVENGKRIKAYYIDEREEDDSRSAFLTPNNFNCLHYVAQSNENVTINSEFEKVQAIKDESGHWYVIPNNLLNEFMDDEQDEDFVDSGNFNKKYGKYRTGGDLNLIQLYVIHPDSQSDMPDTF